MIVFISDLHLMDGTLDFPKGQAGSAKTDPLANAFAQVYKDLAEMANKAGAEEVKVVFLGDTFDLLQSAEWFNAASSVRPWDEWNSPPLISQATAIMNGILANNQGAFQVISGGLKAPFTGKTATVFIPGNHDRLCAMPSLRPLVEKCLGTLSNASFAYTFHDIDHGVYARHGQEWDAYNFEDSAAFRHRQPVDLPNSDYERPPIGDLLTVEVAARLPGEVEKNLPPEVTGAAKDAIMQKVAGIFDVRPLPAIIPWLFYQVRNDSNQVKDAVDKAVKTIASELRKMPFVIEWMDKHDAILNPFDDASNLNHIMKLCELNGIQDMDKCLSVGQKIMSWFPDDNHASRAVDDFSRLDADSATKGKMLYVAYGHTHTPEQKAIEALPDGRGRVYLNTGTWRPSYEQGLTKRGFVGWHSLTYTVIYTASENVANNRKVDYPTFEVWTGGLKDIQ